MSRNHQLGTQPLLNSRRQLSLSKIITMMVPEKTNTMTKFIRATIIPLNKVATDSSKKPAILSSTPLPNQIQSQCQLQAMGFQHLESICHLIKSMGHKSTLLISLTKEGGLHPMFLIMLLGLGKRIKAQVHLMLGELA